MTANQASALDDIPPGFLREALVKSIQSKLDDLEHLATGIQSHAASVAAQLSRNQINRMDLGSMREYGDCARNECRSVYRLVTLLEMVDKI